MSTKNPSPGAHVRVACMLALSLGALADAPGDAMSSQCDPDHFDHAVSAPDGALTLDTTLELVRRASPATRIAALEAVALHHDARQTARLNNPVLTAETENFAGSAPFGGFDQTESTFGLSQTVRLGDKRRLEFRAAQARAAVADSDRFVVLRATELEATRRFYELAAADAVARSAAEIFAISNDFANAVARRVEVGKSPPTELARARTAQAIARADAANTRAAANAARYALAQLWGENQPAFDVAIADLESPLSLPGALDPDRAIEAHPRFLAARARELARAAELRYARAQAYPDVTLGMGVRRFEAAGDALVATFNLPLPLFDRNQDATRAAGIRIEGAEASTYLARVSLSAALRDALARAEGAESRRAALLDEARPAAIEAERATRLGYEQGKFNLTTALDARASLVEVLMQGIDAGLATRLAESAARALTSTAPFDNPTCPGGQP